MTNAMEQELQRRVMEARARLREGFTTMDKVDELMRRVAKKRGERAAQQLRHDMREQWRIRDTWMESGAGPPDSPPAQES